MKILLAPLLIAVSLPAFAEVEPKIHKLCIEAKDYAGCVRAMKGETMPTSRVINSQGADIAEGNSCPSGYAYIGGGNCREVSCGYGKSNNGSHDPRLAGKTMPNGKDRWVCKRVMLWNGTLNLGENTVRTSNNPNCPAGEPKIGFNNTCDTQTEVKFSKEEIKRNQCDFKLKTYDCSYDAYLVANPAIKQWAELNPAMAEKERIRLQSVD